MRAPSHAPAVRYPHGRSAVVGWLLLAVAGCGLTSLLGWLVLGTAQADLAIKAASGLGLWLVCCAVAWRWWRRMPVGQLTWDGGQWVLDSVRPGQAQAVQGSPQVHLDLQWGMLLSVRAPQGRGNWLWLERRSNAVQWLALRRAVYSPARSQAPDLGPTTGSTPSQRNDGAPTQT